MRTPKSGHVQHYSDWRGTNETKAGETSVNLVVEPWIPARKIVSLES